VLGVSFATSNATAFADGSNQSLKPFGLSDVRVGDYVEVRGGAAGPLSALQATVVKRSGAQNGFYLEGPALNLLLPNLRILGVQIITTPQTRFPGGGLLGAVTFFLQAPNRIVRVRGTLSGPMLVAEKIEFVN
jgi:hypothetical protein